MSIFVSKCKNVIIFDENPIITYKTIVKGKHASVCLRHRFFIGLGIHKLGKPKKHDQKFLLSVKRPRLFEPLNSEVFRISSKEDAYS